VNGCSNVSGKHAQPHGLMVRVHYLPPKLGFDMPRLVEIMEYNTDAPDVLHRVMVPTISEQGGYRSILTTTAFGNFWTNKKFPFDKKKNHCVPKIISKWFSVRFIHHEFEKFDLLLKPTIQEHVSIWDFYKSINWDYKKKKII
jgi:hypothetical protein